MPGTPVMSRSIGAGSAPISETRDQSSPSAIRLGTMAPAPAASAVSRLDPRVKLVATVLAATAIFAFQDVTSLALIVAAILIFLAAGRLLGAWLALLRSVWLIVAIVLVLDGLYYGLGFGAITAARFILLLTLFSAFFLSTDPDDLALALVALHCPYNVAFIVSTSAKYVPVVAQELREIEEAFQARGIARGRYPWELIRFYAAILAPLVVATIRRSLRLSEAMEARAFGLAAHRSFLRRLKFRSTDWGFLAGAIAGWGALLLWHALIKNGS